MAEIMRIALGTGLGLVMLAAAGLAAHAKDALPMSADPALEARVMAVAEELRCLVCQNETIAASQADLAVDLRKQIRIKLQQGQSEVQILDFMVARYGEFVRYRPALNAGTVLLWVGPFALLAVAGVVLMMNIRQRRRLGAAPPPLNEAERQRLNALLGEADTAGASRP
ncbi:MAG: cytochrome c-type biogenesis protein CcmH [Rhizobacter sp.]|nr:cytochrome c-type biogenesis protein CcmH [Rhizobacter sp.]